MPRDKGCGRIHALFPTYEILVIVRAFVLFWSSSVLSSEKEFFLGTAFFVSLLARLWSSIIINII